MNNFAIATILTILFITPIHSKEPNNKDIADAISYNFEPFKKEVNSLSKQCKEFTESKLSKSNKKNRSNNIFMEMQCQRVGLIKTISLNNVRLIDCEKAVGMPGYICDLFINVNIEKYESNQQKSEFSFTGLSEEIETKFSRPQTARFVFDGKEWIMMDIVQLNKDADSN